MRILATLSAFAILAACTAASDDDATFPSEMAVPIATPGPAPDASPESPELLRDADGEPYAWGPSARRDLTDMVAGCPHMNPDRRPRGSNCYGTFPEQCGADRASAYIGKTLTPGLRETIAAFSPTGDTRFIEPGQAVIQDLRDGRLNVLLDQRGVITKADCY